MCYLNASLGTALDYDSLGGLYVNKKNLNAIQKFNWIGSKTTFKTKNDILLISCLKTIR